MGEIPVIDISRGEQAVGDIERASRDVGFMYMTGHDIPAATIVRVRSAISAYFALPLAVKLRDRITRDNYRGYIPLGFFSANAGDGAADRYEGYKLHHETPADDPVCAACDLYGQNRWPEQPQDFRESLTEYWKKCERVADTLLRAFARILGVSPDRFLALFESPLTNMTLLHYPAQDPNSAAFGLHPHKDTDVFTIVPPDPVGGLMIRCRGAADWIRADAPGDALTVNIGDLLELWSGGYLVSTPHKVVNTSGVERYSFPYFVVPRFDTVVEPMRLPQPGFERARVHVGDASRAVWRTNWQDAKLTEAQRELVEVNC